MNSSTAGARIRVSISATSAIRRAGLESIIANSTTTKLVGSMYGLDNLSRHLRQFDTDVLLADLDRADLTLVTRSPELDDERGAVNIVALVDEPESAWVIRALRAGVKAILSRSAPAEDILYAIQSAFSGLIVLEPVVTENLLRRLRPVLDDVGPAFSEALTTREIQILQMLAEGVSNKAIAARLKISEHTVKFHISSVLSKMGAISRTEAVTRGIRNGLIVI
jgi:two-component system, NarL family, response regulator YdfI